MWFCSLDDEQLAQRRREWREVATASRVGPSAWRDEPGVRERLEQLIAAEAECCPGLRFDLQTPWWHLGEAADLARGFPDQPIILNHTGLPADRSPDGIAGWKAAMTRLAQCPNVAVKISGLGQPGQEWTVEANRGIVLTTIELFGVARCMFASNFPVDSLCAGFDRIFSGFRRIVADFSAGEQRALFHDNAIRLYGIP